MFAKFMIVLCSLLLAGCASLRVDVDVYKGPLINEPDVQLKQVAAQAIAAQPLIRTMIVDTYHGGYDVKPYKPYVKELRTSLEALADMIELDPQVVSIVSKLAADCTFDKQATRLAECIAMAEGEIALRFSAPQIQAQLVTARSKLLTDSSPDVDSIAAHIGQMAQAAQKGGIVKQIKLWESDPRMPEYKKDLRNDLVEFAERARWIGNHAKLFLKLLNDEMAGQAQPFSPSPIVEPSRLLRQAIETHSLILQTIGNSILSQTNEIERMAGLNSDSRNARLKARELTVWGSVGWARNSVLAAVKARNDTWTSFPSLINSDFKSSLLAHLNAADNKSLEAISLLGESIPHYQKAIKPFDSVAKAYAATSKLNCGGKPEGKPAELLQACLSSDFAEMNTLQDVLLGDGKEITNTEASIALSALRTHLENLKTKLEGWKTDLVLLRNWKASLEGAEMLLRGGLAGSEVKNPREVIDLGVSRLRGMQVEAVLAEDATRRARIEDAIQILLTHRAGMVPLVPSASYLRNSLPATSLSEGIREKDEANMLWQAFIRAFPDTKANGEEQMRLDVDKQYWQPVNRVRVSGGGSVNKVLAKDDVGNWYVKSFDTDKKAVIETMKKLALYNLAGATPALGALRTQLANAKGLSVDQLKMSDLGIGKAMPVSSAPIDNDLLVVTQPAITEAPSDAPNGTVADVYKVVLTRYGKALQTTYQTLQCDTKVGDVNTDVCADGKLTTKAQEELGKMNLKTLDEEVARLLGERTSTCKPDIANKSCKGTSPSKPASESASSTKLTKADMQGLSLDELKLSADKPWSVASMTVSDLSVSELRAMTEAAAATGKESVSKITGGKLTAAKIESITLKPGSVLHADQVSLIQGKAGGIEVPKGTYTQVELAAQAGQATSIFQSTEQLADVQIMSATSSEQGGKVKLTDAVFKGGTLSKPLFGAIAFSGTLIKESSAAATASGDAPRFETLSSLINKQADALKRLKSDMETLSASISKPLQ